MVLHWHTEPLLLLSLVGASWLHALLLHPFRSLWDGDYRKSHLRDAFRFHSGMIVLYLAVGSPLDQLGEDYLFFLHMVQHILLIYVAAPLIVMGIPAALADKVLENRHLRGLASVFFHPVVAGLLFCVNYTLWHIPVLYEAALQSKPIHILEHAMMFGTAVLIWWPLLSPSRVHLPPLRDGPRVLFLFLLMIGMTPVFAFLTLSDVALYETYIWAPRIIPALDPLNDQILGGLIMKTLTLVVSLALMSLTFYRWSERDRSHPAAFPFAGKE
jgi:putative membrane protein